MRARATGASALSLAAILVTGCAALGALGQLIQAPRFEVDDARGAELRLLGPSRDRPMGGAGIRIWTRVENPNPFGFTLAALAGSLFLEETRAANVDFPLGLPLTAQQDTVIPLDLSVGFSDFPNLGDVARRALVRNTLQYSLEGTLAVDAGPLGTPTFGPRTWLEGDVRVIR